VALARLVRSAWRHGLDEAAVRAALGGPRPRSAA